MREIHFYKTASGNCPVEEFLKLLSAKQAKKVTWVLSLVEELPSIPVKYFKKRNYSGAPHLYPFVSSRIA